MDSINTNIQPVISRIDSINQKIVNAHNTIQQNQTLITQKLNNLGEPDYCLLVVGAILGAIFGYGISLLHNWYSNLRKNKRISSVCAPFEGIYLSYEKYDKDEKPKYYFELKRDKNRFFIKNGIAIIGHEDFNSEITMNEPTYQRGSGYYQHEKSLDGATRFGFIDIQLAQNEILVHVTIHKDGKENSDAYRWVKQDYSKKAELEKKSRNEQQKNLKVKFSSYLDK